MITVTYEHAFPYTYDPRGEPFPTLTLRLSRPGQTEPALDIDAYLDSGARRSLVEGRLAAALGIDLFRGPEVRYVSTSGAAITARLHRIQLSHPALGSFELEVGFSTIPITRNLLGRDFFNLIQIGFRERHLTFYLTGAP